MMIGHQIQNWWIRKRRRPGRASEYLPESVRGVHGQ